VVSQDFLVVFAVLVDFSADKVNSSSVFPSGLTGPALHWRYLAGLHFNEGWTRHGRNLAALGAIHGSLAGSSLRTAGTSRLLVGFSVLTMLEQNVLFERVSAALTKKSPK
jgi:hypothetical protein